MHDSSYEDILIEYVDNAFIKCQNIDFHTQKILKFQFVRSNTFYWFEGTIALILQAQDYR